MNIDTVLQSIITVRSLIPDDAFTATTLGTLREGSGVVIREEGLVLTIGYLITEAQEVWLTRHDGQVIPGHALAYDQETGFGLVQALMPLGVSAVEFGNATEARVEIRLRLQTGSVSWSRPTLSPRRNLRAIGSMYWTRRSSLRRLILPGEGPL